MNVVTVLVLIVALASAGIVQADDGEPLVLNDSNIDQVLKEYDVVMVNFYADWCRFCQMLRPVYEQASKLLGDSVNARLGKVNCEAADTKATREKYHISKYPTLKVFRNGEVLKQEYRGQRSATAIEAFMREMVRDPLVVVNGDAALEQQAALHTQSIVGRFAHDETPEYKSFVEVSKALRDSCTFIVDKRSPSSGATGVTVNYRSRVSDVMFAGDVKNSEEFLHWARDLCNPMVREITFENGEGLTEEGLPFLILFYDPENVAPIKEYTDVVNARLTGERGVINFITADGTKFAHPLRHLGKSRKDLPVLAFDTFKHMYLFKHFRNIHRPGILENFVKDLHSGKLHHDFHNPPAVQEEDDYEEYFARKNEEKIAHTEAAAAAAHANSEHADEDAQKRAAEAAERAEQASQQALAAAKALEEKRIARAAAEAEGKAEQAKVEEEQPKEEKGKVKTIKEKVETARQELEETKMTGNLMKQLDKVRNEHEDHDDPGKPVPVKSVLQKLKPSENRYSFARNRDEL